MYTKKTPHRVIAWQKEALKILCICSPPYSHEKTRILNSKWLDDGHENRDEKSLFT